MRKLWFLLVVLVFALAACGQQTGGNENANTADPGEVVEALRATYDQMFSELAADIPHLGIVNPTLLSTSNGVAPLDTLTWDCTGVSATGNLTDADNDGIPANATYNGSCSWSYTSPEVTASFEWKLRDVNIEDADETDPIAGFRAKGEVVWEWTINSESGSITWNFDPHDWVRDGDHWNLDYEGEITWQSGGESGTLDYDLSGTWTPDDSNDPWGSGNLELSGDFTWTEGTCTSTLEITYAEVHYNDDGAIDSGRLDFTVTEVCDDGSGDSVSCTLTWSGPGEPTVSCTP